MPGSGGLRSEVLWGFLRFHPELYSATAEFLNRSFNDIDDASGPNSHRQELQHNGGQVCGGGTWGIPRGCTGDVTGPVLRI